MSNPVIDCLMDHRTVRKFKDKPIESEKLDLILTAGTRAATGGNLQMYSFIVVDDDQIKKTLDKAWNARFIEVSKCPVAIIALIDQYRVRRWLQLHSDREIVSNKPFNFLIAIWDALIALQNMVIAAESMGLGTCYIGSVFEMDLQEILGIPEYVFPAGMVCIGYPAQLPDKSMRLPLDAVVHKNYYHMPSNDDISEWYHERDDVWETVADNVKERLAKKEIFGIAQALAMQKFSPEVIQKRSRNILENLKKAKFVFGE